MKTILLTLFIGLFLIGCNSAPRGSFKLVQSQEVGKPFTAKSVMRVVEQNTAWTKYSYSIDAWTSNVVYITVKKDTVVSIWWSGHKGEGKK